MNAHGVNLRGGKCWWSGHNSELFFLTQRRGSAVLGAIAVAKEIAEVLWGFLCVGQIYSALLINKATGKWARADAIDRVSVVCKGC